jgi:hypothetical protein
MRKRKVVTIPDNSAVDLLARGALDKLKEQFSSEEGRLAFLEQYEEGGDSRERFAAAVDTQRGQLEKALASGNIPLAMAIWGKLNYMMGMIGGLALWIEKAMLDAKRDVGPRRQRERAKLQAEVALGVAAEFLSADVKRMGKEKFYKEVGQIAGQRLGQKPIPAETVRQYLRNPKKNR